MSKPTNAAIVDLNGRKWTPFESLEPTGHVSYTEAMGEIHIPYGKDPVSKVVQAHELSHVRYSAKVWPNLETALPRLKTLAGTTGAVVGYAEDMRITALAGRLGIKTLPAFGNADDKPIIDGWVKSFVKAGIPRERVQKAAQFILNSHTTLVAALGLSLDTLQVQANAERYIVAAAQHLHKLLSTGEDDSKPQPDGGGKSDKAPAESKGDTSKSKSDKREKGESKPADEDTDGAGDDKDDKDDTEEGDAPSGGGDEDSDEDSDGAGAASEGDADDAGGSDGSDADSSSGKPGGKGGDGRGTIDLSKVSLPDLRQAMVNSIPAPVDTAKLIQTFQHTLDTADWIPVKSIERMPLVRRAAQARNRGRKLSEVGVALGSAYDAVSPNERRPFIAKRKGGAGGLTVVIDCSSSMSISDKQMETLLLKHPQGVVVTYSSYVHPDSAVVRVIASHGRLAANKDFRDGMAPGNGCDGPVLEWLAKQSGEKVWVCDGVMTGQGDRLVKHDWEARAAWLKAKRIEQFTSLREYLKSLT